MKLAAIAIMGLLLAAVTGVWLASRESTLWDCYRNFGRSSIYDYFVLSPGPDRDTAMHPVAVLTSDRNYAIVVGLAVGAYTALYYSPLYGMAFAFVFAMTGSLACPVASA
jgi:hypothetical protein